MSNFTLRHIQLLFCHRWTMPVSSLCSLCVTKDDNAFNHSIGEKCFAKIISESVPAETDTPYLDSNDGKGDLASYFVFQILIVSASF